MWFLPMLLLSMCAPVPDERTWLKWTFV